MSNNILMNKLPIENVPIYYCMYISSEVAGRKHIRKKYGTFKYFKSRAKHLHKKVLLYMLFIKILVNRICCFYALNRQQKKKSKRDFLCFGMCH